MDATLTCTVLQSSWIQSVSQSAIAVNAAWSDHLGVIRGSSAPCSGHILALEGQGLRVKVQLAAVGACAHCLHLLLHVRKDWANALKDVDSSREDWAVGLQKL